MCFEMWSNNSNISVIIILFVHHTFPIVSLFWLTVIFQQGFLVTNSEPMIRILKLFIVKVEFVS